MDSDTFRTPTKPARSTGGPDLTFTPPTLNSEVLQLFRFIKDNIRELQFKKRERNIAKSLSERRDGSITLEEGFRITNEQSRVPFTMVQLIVFLLVDGSRMDLIAAADLGQVFGPRQELFFENIIVLDDRVFSNQLRQYRINTFPGFAREEEERARKEAERLVTQDEKAKKEQNRVAETQQKIKLSETKMKAGFLASGMSMLARASPKQLLAGGMVSLPLGAAYVAYNAASSMLQSKVSLEKSESEVEDPQVQYLFMTNKKKVALLATTSVASYWLGSLAPIEYISVGMAGYYLENLRPELIRTVYNKLKLGSKKYNSILYECALYGKLTELRTVFGSETLLIKYSLLSTNPESYEKARIQYVKSSNNKIIKNKALSSKIVDVPFLIRGEKIEESKVNINKIITSS